MAVDLKKMVERVSREWFGCTLRPRVRWGSRREMARHGRMYKCAYYDPAQYRITINHILKSERVPEAVIETLVLHELLHILWGPGHSKRFCAAEKAHPDYWRVDKWLGYHLRGLELEAERHRHG